VPGTRSIEEEWARTADQLSSGRGTYEVTLKNLQCTFPGSILSHRLCLSYQTAASNGVEGRTRTKNEPKNERDIKQSHADEYMINEVEGISDLSLPYMHDTPSMNRSYG